MNFYKLKKNVFETICKHVDFENGLRKRLKGSTVNYNIGNRFFFLTLDYTNHLRAFLRSYVSQTLECIYAQMNKERGK